MAALVIRQPDGHPLIVEGVSVVARLQDVVPAAPVQHDLGVRPDLGGRLLVRLLRLRVRGSGGVGVRAGNGDLEVLRVDRR